MPTQDPSQWWAERCAHIAGLMKNTGVGELIIRRKADGKYSFQVTPEAETTPKPPPIVPQRKSDGSPTTNTPRSRS